MHERPRAIPKSLPEPGQAKPDSASHATTSLSKERFSTFSAKDCTRENGDMELAVLMNLSDAPPSSKAQSPCSLPTSPGNPIISMKFLQAHLGQVEFSRLSELESRINERRDKVATAKKRLQNLERRLKALEHMEKTLRSNIENQNQHQPRLPVSNSRCTRRDASRKRQYTVSRRGMHCISTSRRVTAAKSLTAARACSHTSTSSFGLARRAQSVFQVPSLRRPDPQKSGTSTKLSPETPNILFRLHVQGAPPAHHNDRQGLANKGNIPESSPYAKVLIPRVVLRKPVVYDGPRRPQLANHSVSRLSLAESSVLTESIYEQSLRRLTRRRMDQMKEPCNPYRTPGVKRSVSDRDTLMRYKLWENESRLKPVGSINRTPSVLDRFARGIFPLPMRRRHGKQDSSVSLGMHMQDSQVFDADIDPRNRVNTKAGRFTLRKILFGF